MFIYEALLQTPLHYAAKYGSEIIARELLSCKNINIEGRSLTTSTLSPTPLHHACLFANYNIASLLIKAGASLEIVDRNKQNFFHKACASGQESIVDALAKMVEAEKGREFLDQLLILEDKDDNTPAMVAVNSGSVEVTRLLIDVIGVDIEHAESVENETLLHKASKGDNLTVAKLLIEVISALLRSYLSLHSENIEGR